MPWEKTRLCLLGWWSDITYILETVASKIYSLRSINCSLWLCQICQSSKNFFPLHIFSSFLKNFKVEFTKYQNINKYSSNYLFIKSILQGMKITFVRIIYQIFVSCKRFVLLIWLILIVVRKKKGISTTIIQLFY